MIYLLFLFDTSLSQFTTGIIEFSMMSLQTNTLKYPTWYSADKPFKSHIL